MWKVVATIMVVTLVASVKSGLVLAPACPNVSGTGVANVVFASGVSGLQPYALTVGANITVDFKFFATSNTSIAYFDVYAVWTNGNVQETTPLVTRSVGPITVAVYLNTPIVTVSAILIYSGLGLIQPGIVSIDFLVPNLGNSTATFIGSVADENGVVLACQQGVVNISP